jgi:hypothetical protein
MREESCQNSTNVLSNLFNDGAEFQSDRLKLLFQLSLILRTEKMNLSSLDNETFLMAICCFQH